MSLDYKIFRHSYLGFSSNSVLIYGEEDAILVDTCQLLSDAYRLVPELIAMKKRITHIYISHFHPDHHFGTEVLQFAFPDAQVVALPSVVKDLVFTSREKLDMWDIDWLGRDIPLKTTIPVPLAEARLDLEGHDVLLSDGWHGDSVNNSVVWIPSMKVLCATDVAFHNAHVFTIESNVERRRKWRDDVRRLGEFGARVIIPAHCGEPQLQTLQEVSVDASRSYTDPIDWTLAYLELYEDVYDRAKTGAEFVERIYERYGDVKTVDYIVQWQARMLFPKSSLDWFAPLPGEPGEIFLNPDGGFDGDPPKE